MRPSPRLKKHGPFALVALALTLGLAGGSPHPSYADGHEEPAWLGVTVQDLNRDLREALNLPRRIEGALITRVVEGSPADRGGLRSQDVVIEFDGRPVTSADDLIESVRAASPGDAVRVGVQRGRRTVDLRMKLGSRDGGDSEFRGFDRGVRRYYTGDDDDDGDAEAPRAENRRHDRDRVRWFSSQEDDDDDESDSESESSGERSRNRWFGWDSRGDGGWSWRSDDETRHEHRHAGGAYLGVTTMSLGEQLAGYFGVSRNEGVLVTSVMEGTAAEQGGLRAGDVILAVGDETVKNPNHLARLIRKRSPEETVSLRIQRDRKPRTLRIKLGARDFGALPEAPHAPHAPHAPRAFFFGDGGSLQMPDLEEMLPWLEKLEDLPELHLEMNLSEDDLQELRNGMRDGMRELRQRMRGLRDRLRESRIEIRGRLADPGTI